MNNGGVVTRWQICYDRRFAYHIGSVTAVLNILDLVSSDDPADDFSQPVIIGGNQSSVAIVQFQCRIGQWIGNTILAELRPNCTNNHPLWPTALNNKTANHHALARLNKGAGRDVGYVGRR